MVIALVKFEGNQESFGTISLGVVADHLEGVRAPESMKKRGLGMVSVFSFS